MGGVTSGRFPSWGVRYWDRVGLRHWTPDIVLLNYTSGGTEYGIGSPRVLREVSPLGVGYLRPGRVPESRYYGRLGEREAMGSYWQLRRLSNKATVGHLVGFFNIQTTLVGFHRAKLLKPSVPNFPWMAR